MPASTTSDFAADVLICGAGAAGLTLALDLARRCIPFRLIEKRQEAFAGSRGKGIQPRTQELFEDLGIIDRIVAAGGIYPPMRHYGDDGSYTETDHFERHDPTPAEPFHIPLMIPQFLTERIMRERLAELGQQVEFGCELVGFDQDAKSVTARLSSGTDEETLRFRYLVGADGGRSFVRGVLGIDFPGKTLGVRAMVADVALLGLDRNAWHQFNGRDMERMVMMVPLGGTELFQIQAPVPLEGAVDLSSEGIGRMITERTGREDIRIESVSWASAYPMNARLAGQYRSGRVFLTGDAAHIHPPTGGQGLNTSVQDAYNLGWKLAAVLGGAPDRLLDSYEAERRPIAAEVLGVSTGLLDAAMKGGGMRRGRDVQQLDLSCPESPLTLAWSGPPRPLLPGDRAPDAPLRGAAGHGRRLFELLAGPHWTLIGWEVGSTITAPCRNLHIHLIGTGSELEDDDGHFQDAYGLEAGEWVLIRPDGYIGAIVSSAEAGKLRSYFVEVGLEPAKSPNNPN